MAFCVCSATTSNTGTPSKQLLMDVAKNLIFVQTFADDGTRNGIAKDAVLDQSYFDALITNADLSKRWYPTKGYKNVEDLRDDQVTEGFNDGTSLFVREGARNFTGVIPSAGTVFLGKLQGFACVETSVYIVDDCGNLHGSQSADGSTLYPIRIEQGTFYARLVKSTDTTVQKVQLDFQFSILESDADLRIIQASETTADLLTLSGLIDVRAAVSSINTTGFVAVLTTDFGSFQNKTIVPNWLLADFNLENETTPASITITSVTEAPKGTYTFVIPVQASADVLKLSGLKGSLELAETTITIP